MPNVGVLVFLAVLGSVICAPARVAVGAVVFAVSSCGDTADPVDLLRSGMSGGAL